MRHLKNLSGAFLAALVCCPTSGTSQENAPDALSHTPAYAATVDGASTPELISDEALLLSLSGLLASSGPSGCSTEKQPQGFSATPPCLDIDGVDMSKAERLADEFRSYRNHTAATDHAEFCAQQQTRGVSYLNRAEFAAEIDRFLEESSMKNVDFFMDRGAVLLGQDSMDRLMSWASENLKSDIDERKVDFAKLMEHRNLSPDQFLETVCSAGR